MLRLENVKFFITNLNIQTYGSAKLNFLSGPVPDIYKGIPGAGEWLRAS